MSDRELLAAAEFARRNGVLDRMVSTSERTREEFHFAQRFPMPFSDNMKAATKKLGLDMPWTYGLVRQESRFVMDARSSAGASGLMQLMPATAKLVAKKIGLTNYSSSQINSLETNILLGTHYLKMMMDEFGHSQTLATAAYNAGPGRPRAWRSRLTRTVEGAIFAETIPFNETRDYVKKVMSNATYYAALTEEHSQSLKKRMGKVSPP
jgi:soluble lytic murein transglycosylase